MALGRSSASKPRLQKLANKWPELIACKVSQFGCQCRNKRLSGTKITIFKYLQSVARRKKVFIAFPGKGLANERGNTLHRNELTESQLLAACTDMPAAQGIEQVINVPRPGPATTFQVVRSRVVGKQLNIKSTFKRL